MISTDTEWFRAEASHEDEVIGESVLPRMFLDSVDRNGSLDAQWFKSGVYDRSLAPDVVPEPPAGEWGSITYDEMGDIVRRLATGFRELGVEHGDRVGIYADTRMEWAQSDLALLTAGATVTTVYTESSAEQVEYLLDDPGATGVVCENGELLDTVASVEDDLDLGFVVVIDEYEGYEDRDDVYTLADVYDLGADAYDADAVDEWVDAIDPADLASLIYTSGTTGRPKGVQLTHANFRSNVNQVRRRFGPRPDRGPDVPTLDTDSRVLSFLPLAHVYERTSGHFVMFASGVTVAYAESTDTVAEDIEAVGPTSANSVPRVYERIFASMREQASGSSVSESIFEWAVGVAREWSRTERPGAVLRAKHAVADRLVYSTVKESMGGNIEMFTSGGGSLSQRLAELFEGMGLPIHEGYGLTETSPVATTNPPEDLRPGTLGPLMVGMEGKLDASVVSADQMEKATGDIGELLLRGPNVTDGYWNRPDATESSFTEADDGGDPWFRTGDIIEATDDGYLVYHDRLKQVLVLDTGKNVAPGPIEDEFATSERIAQAMVLGDNEKFISALFVPDMEAMARWAERNDLDLPDDPEELATDERVVEWIREEVDAVNADLAKHERIKEFRVVGTEWTPDNDLLTPSMKIKRRNVLDRYEHKVEEIYGRDDE
ncbi:AMP-dependent synthetase/ligase [Halosegnis marinus]|uniref:AMP-dependent synthetase/ligase n=1 Tax=Halosegnis marinus TaxID=3034023 RepID=A0ABD5ZT26_9EURY|nr:long-chain fatty acid--CoA ligase [Halosegnis sp. DT85]